MAVENVTLTDGLEKNGSGFLSNAAVSPTSVPSGVFSISLLHTLPGGGSPQGWPSRAGEPSGSVALAKNRTIAEGALV
ncbi:hypothetical protein [uncultured Roseibium sp.]|uniref:hypothetical protein n=1 Tax=uncultured Roseibium sp. TaxID=1936171 RepID=UPI00261B6542|nr:hypothetical protein [uncultured Roseibium sp.]